MAIIGATGSLGGFAGGNALARLLVVFSGDTSSLDAAVARAQGTAKGFGEQATGIGKALTRSVTLPILAVGGAALFMASQFESSLGRIAGLTPIVDQVSGGINTIRQDLLDLAQEVPTAPNDLAESLYFAGSAGLSAADAFSVVRASAQGAAIGMGEASDISRVLIAALNNFGAPAGGPLTAAAAMDALTAAIREGTAAPDEMAIALGRVLPVAKEAGVTFQETVASVAALTNIGIPTRVATTSLRALFTELLAPTQQAAERLDTLGLSADKVRNVLAQFGPIGAFELLENAVHGDEDALRDILPQIRGFTAYLGLADDRLNASKRIFDQVTNSSGDFQKALAIISKTPQFRFGIALNKLRVAAIDLGTTLFPVFNKIIDVIGAVGDALANIPEPVQKVGVAFALLAAAVGPVLQLLGNMQALIANPINSLKAFATNAIVAGLAVVTLVASFQSLASGSKSLSSTLITVVAAATATFSALRLLQGAVNAGLIGVNALSLGFVSMSTGGLALAAVGVGVLVAAIGLLIGKSGQMQKAVDQATESFAQGARTGQLFRQAIADIGDEAIAERLRNIAKAVGVLNQSMSVDTLSTFSQGIGTQLTGQLNKLYGTISRNKGALGAVVSPEELAMLGKAIPVIQQATAAGGDLGANLKRAGIDGSEFLDLIGRLGQAAPIEAVRNQATNVDALARSYQGAADVLKKFQAETEATITLRGADARAVDQYAAQLGVSSEFLQGRLDDVGVSALGMDENAKAAFEDLVFVSDETGQKVSAHVAEMQAKIDEATKNISESIAGAFSGFEKAESQVKGTTDSLLNNFVANSRAIVEMTANLNRLAQQGVPSGLLQQLAEGGPELVKKFVDATPAQLKRLTANYEAELAATDAAILDEANLQEGKGKSMVGKFVTGILSNSQLPPQVASRIANDTVQAFASGKIGKAGLEQARIFANGLGTVRNLSRKEAGRAMDAFVQGIGSRNLLNLGKAQVRELANGIAQASGISENAAQKLVNNTINALKPDEANSKGTDTANQYRAGILAGQQAAKNAGDTLAHSSTSGMDSAKGPANTAGQGVGASFATGLAIKTGAAYAAGFAVGQAGAKGIKDGSKNSPKYASYYIGIDVAHQMQEGLEKGQEQIGKFGFEFPITARLKDEGGTRHKTDEKTPLHVRLDRRRFDEVLDYDFEYRGWG